MKNDIENMDDIKQLVNAFYNKAVKHETLGHIFNDVAKVNWEHHLPIMYKFWASVLLGESGYLGNPMEAHFKLNEKIKLEDEHFNSWKTLFMITIDELFEGRLADEAKKKAVTIADLMFYKIHNYYQSPGVKINRKEN